MIHDTVAYINGLLDGLGIFPTRYGITALEQMQSGDNEITTPAFYIGGGDSEAINFDFTTAQLYHRITGEITREEVESDTGCGLNIVQRAPMRVVCYFPRNVYLTDNANIDSKVGQNVASVVSQSNIKTLAASLQVDYVSVQVSGINLDRYDVFNAEFSGVGFTVPSDYGFIAIDYTIEIAGDESCMLAYGCGDAEIDIDELIIDNICPVVTIYNSDGTLNTTVAAGGSYTLPETQEFMLGNYLSVASTTQTFVDFIGYDINNMYVNLQGAGNMGHLPGLSVARKLITNWDSATGVATFAQALQSGWQITVIGTN